MKIHSTLKAKWLKCMGLWAVIISVIGFAEAVLSLVLALGFQTKARGKQVST